MMTELANFAKTLFSKWFRCLIRTVSSMETIVLIYLARILIESGKVLQKATNQKFIISKNSFYIAIKKAKWYFSAISMGIQ